MNGKLLWLMMLICIHVGCGPSKPSRRIILDRHLSQSEQQKLSPEVRRLYGGLVRGDIVGSQASDFARAFEAASVTTDSDGTTTYLFYLPESEAGDPPPGSDGCPYIICVVVNGQIYAASLVVPLN